MGLYSQWLKMASDAKTREEVERFWEEYSTAEKNIYSTILENPTYSVKGVVKDLAVEFKTSNQLFMGFLDGINTSLKNSLNLEEISEDSEINLEIDLEKLYFNMHAAQADYLYNLPQWDKIFDEEKRLAIEKDYKKSKTIVKEEKIGRNDPCPCGSGKKYKKCCGK